MMARLFVAALAALGSYCTPSTVTPPPDASPPPAPALEGGSLHSYRCAVGDASWTCSDGLTVPVGTCPSYCVPVGP